MQIFACLLVSRFVRNIATVCKFKGIRHHFKHITAYQKAIVVNFKKTEHRVLVMPNTR